MLRDFILTRANSFQYAISGWWYVIRTQRNAWVHAAASLCVIVLSAWLQLPARDWATLILTIAIVWTAEFINTALESVVDLAAPGHHPLAKVGKDVGAAGVFIAALASIIVGLLILGPPLWIKITCIYR